MRASQLFCLCALLLAGLGCAPTVEDFQVESFKEPGKKVSLSSFRGKVVLIDFWATWCGPCRQVMPEVEQMHTELGPKGLEVMGITDELRDKVTPFKKDSKFTYPIYLDPFRASFRRFGVDGIPMFVVIDKQGTMVYSGTADPDAARAAIEAALAK